MCLLNKEMSTSEDKEDTCEEVQDIQEKQQHDEEEQEEKSTVELCFIAVFWGLLLAQVLRNLWVIYLLPIPVTIVAVKRIGVCQIRSDSG